MSKTKSRQVVISALNNLRKGELQEALLQLTTFADTHIKNRRTAECFERAIREETHEIEAHKDPIDRTVLIDFGAWDGDE